MLPGSRWRSGDIRLSCRAGSVTGTRGCGYVSRERPRVRVPYSSPSRHWVSLGGTSRPVGYGLIIHTFSLRTSIEWTRNATTYFVCFLFAYKPCKFSSSRRLVKRSPVHNHRFISYRSMDEKHICPLQNPRGRNLLANTFPRKVFERLGNDTVQPGSTRLSEGFERISKSYYPYRVASLDKFGRVVESHRV